MSEEDLISPVHYKRSGRGFIRPATPCKLDEPTYTEWIHGQRYCFTHAEYAPLGARKCKYDARVWACA